MGEVAKQERPAWKSEATIRFECRQQHREDGALTCPYSAGSRESFFWKEEARTIRHQEWQSI